MASAGTTTTKVCPKCGGTYQVIPAGFKDPRKEQEEIWCPHCNEIIDSIETSEVMMVYKGPSAPSEKD